MESRWGKGEQISATEWVTAMKRIRKAADGALRLTEDLLAVERLSERDGGRTSKNASKALVDVTDIIKEAFSLQWEHLERARCEVTVRCEDFVARGHWDRGLLLRVFSNLLQNASRYGPAAPVGIALFRRADRLGIRFTDHGPGFTGTRGFTAGVLGPGLSRRHGFGLWIVRRAVARLGGSLAVKSTPGSGTTFTIEIPGLAREGRTVRAISRRSSSSRLRGIGSEPDDSRQLVARLEPIGPHPLDGVKPTARH